MTASASGDVCVTDIGPLAIAATVESASTNLSTSKPLNIQTIQAKGETAVGGGETRV